MKLFLTDGELLAQGNFFYQFKRVVFVANQERLTFPVLDSLTGVYLSSSICATMSWKPINFRILLTSLISHRLPVRRSPSQSGSFHRLG